MKTTLMLDEDVENKKGIYTYVLSRKEKCLNIRALQTIAKWYAKTITEENRLNKNRNLFFNTLNVLLSAISFIEF